MKKGIIFQILITLILLLGWNLIHFGYEIIQAQSFETASQAQMIIYAEDFDNLQQLQADLAQVYYIKKVIVESDTTVANTLIENYDLGNVRDILVSYNLPNLMTIKFDGRVYRSAEKAEFEDFLASNYPQINATFDQELWEKVESELSEINENYLLANGLYLALLLFIIIFMRIHFEVKHDEFWRIYRSAGGKHSQRNWGFIKDSLILCLVPLALIVATYYALLYRGTISYQIDYHIFAVELGALVLAALIARTALWSKF
ncbi:MAG: hypothetical protein R6U84_08360 [Candidatus Cloacimonadales bacterium]